MRPELWPNKQHIVSQLMQSGHEDVQTWAKIIENVDHSDQFNEFCQRLHQHDQYRGLDFAHTFPEMASEILTFE
jgi:hypothetical protein